MAKATRKFVKFGTPTRKHELRRGMKTKQFEFRNEMKTPEHWSRVRKIPRTRRTSKTWNVWQRGKFSPDKMSTERKLSKTSGEEITHCWTLCFYIWSNKTNIEQSRNLFAFISNKLFAAYEMSGEILKCPGSDPWFTGQKMSGEAQHFAYSVDLPSTSCKSKCYTNDSHVTDFLIVPHAVHLSWKSRCKLLIILRICITYISTNLCMQIGFLPF